MNGFFVCPLKKYFEGPSKMNGFSSRKTAAGLTAPRKASSRLVVRDSVRNQEQNTQMCSRIGCGGSTINSTQGKAKKTRHLSHLPASGKQVVKSSSKTPASLSNPRKIRLDTSKPVTRPGDPEINLGQNDVSGEASTSSSNPHIRNGKKSMRRSELCISDSSMGASSSLTLKNGNNGVRNGASTSKHRFGSFKHSVNNVVQSSELNLNRKGEIGKKRIGEAECSLSTRGNLRGGISITNSRRTSNSPSVEIQRSTPRVRRLNEQDDDSNRLSNVLVNEENVGQYSLVEIVEMLLALERIEQDEDMSYEEQLVVLETNLFLSGLSSFHDQHREMRLNIDNMSYEELLALEETMGNVSTALSEEVLAKCLKKSTYHTTTTTEQGTPPQGDDIKCSICQEEYEESNEVGKLRCEHQYHVECIQRWLRMKNWCPICKASAAPSPSSS